MTPARVGLLYPYPEPVSPQAWSGTPSGLAGGLAGNGVELVPIGAKLPPGIRQGVAALSRAGGRRGPLANRGPLASRARTLEVTRRLRQAGRLDALIAMDTEAYRLDRVLAGAPALPVATYDDGTFALFARHPDSDISRDGIPAAELDRWIERQAAGCRAATVCCVSTGWAGRSVVSDYAVPADRVRVVGMGHRARGGAGVRSFELPRFLFVGVEWGRKNGEAVLRAFTALRRTHPTATLDLVGEHPPVDVAGVTDHGLLRRDDPAAQALLDGLFARATAFVLPSRFDPSPIAYLEAASAGLPVIATTEGGAGELLGDGAITVHPDDDSAILAAMLRLCDPAVAAALGTEAARRAAESTWLNVAARILAALGV
ncbi:MAG TPA: glycosyltransferase family 4 protein [Jatrophihabitans sp.]|nr:glycosyltransferase family 4 protein [Jatrophihabitans sp.]